ncbi:hypothetical protein FF2_018642 [Malus domestica]
MCSLLIEQSWPVKELDNRQAFCTGRAINRSGSDLRRSAPVNLPAKEPPVPRRQPQLHLRSDSGKSGPVQQTQNARPQLQPLRRSNPHFPHRRLIPCPTSRLCNLLLRDSDNAASIIIVLLYRAHLDRKIGTWGTKRKTGAYNGFNG